MILLLVFLLVNFAIACDPPLIPYDTLTAIYGETASLNLEHKAGSLSISTPGYGITVGDTNGFNTFAFGWDSVIVDNLLREGCYRITFHCACYQCESNVLVHRYDSPLPVELLAFWADSCIVLHWRVASEIGDPRYEVYRDNALLKRIAGGQRNYRYHDQTAQPDVTYEYQLACSEESGSWKMIDTTIGYYHLEIYAESLVECSATQVILTLPQSMQVDIRVYNLLGQQVATLVNGRLETGTHRFTFDGSSITSGIYLVRSEFDGTSTVTRKMSLVK